MKTTRAFVSALCLAATVSVTALAAPPRTAVPPTAAPLPEAPTRPPAAPPPVQLVPVPIASQPGARVLLRGFVDLHTHPLSNLGFGGKLLYGGVDASPAGDGSLLPSDPDCKRNVRAITVAQALGHDQSTHGGADLLHNPFPNPDCRDTLRAQFVSLFQSLNKASDPGPDANGFPFFTDWPKWNDITHQKMWVDWIQRSYEGGLRVMVALAVNNKTTADSVAGPGDFATDDRTSADLQIAEIKSFVGRHGFMEMAYNSADLYRIVSSGRLAVVLGVEIDHIGNLGAQQMAVASGPVGGNLLYRPPPPVSEADVHAAIDHLYSEGVRYVFPIHVIDNVFGGAAVYQDVFNLSNLRESGHYWALGCAPAGEGIRYRYRNADQFNPESLAAEAEMEAFAAAKLGLLVNIGAGAPVPAGCPDGMRNTLGLTPLGIFALKDMMRRGMLIDIDHMSELSANGALSIAEQIPAPGYPLSSGHAGLRCVVPGPSCNERSLTAAQYQRIGRLHGMAGIGSEGTQPYQWKDMYTAVTAAMGNGGVGAFGTDTNGFALGMPPPALTRTALMNPPAYTSCVQAVHAANQCGRLAPADKPACASAVSQGEAACAAQYPKAVMCFQNCAHPQGPIQYSSQFPPSALGNQTWDYNLVGVAHYGMLPDFLLAIKSLPGGKEMVEDNLMYGADYFYETWRISEMQSAKVGP